MKPRQRHKGLGHLCNDVLIGSGDGDNIGEGAGAVGGRAPGDDERSVGRKDDEGMGRRRDGVVAGALAQGGEEAAGGGRRQRRQLGGDPRRLGGRGDGQDRQNCNT